MLTQHSYSSPAHCLSSKPGNLLGQQHYEDLVMLQASILTGLAELVLACKTAMVCMLSTPRALQGFICGWIIVQKPAFGIW